MPIFRRDWLADEMPPGNPDARLVFGDNHEKRYGGVSVRLQRDLRN